MLRGEKGETERRMDSRAASSFFLVSFIPLRLTRASLELLHFLSLFRSGFLSRNSIPFQRQALCNIPLSLDSFSAQMCVFSVAVIQFV